MAQRRMFSPDIVSSDAFLDMPVSSQSLYFHLGMNADDDGFVSPKKIMRLLGSSDDDLKVLVAKRFLLPFESGVVVVKHWLIHNLIRSDLYKETNYKKEKSFIGLNENGAYTEMRDGISQLKTIEAPKWLKQRRGELRTANVPQTVPRIGKDRLGKVSKDDEIHRNESSSPSSKELSNTDKTHDSLEITREPQDEIFGGPRQKRDVKEPKTSPDSAQKSTYWALQARFGDMCQSTVGTRPVRDLKAFRAISFAMNRGGLTEKQMIALFEDWFDQRKPDETLLSINAALSSSNINKFKIHN